MMDVSKELISATSIKKSRNKNSSPEDISKLSKDELVEKVIRLELHNKQLKNIIHKLQLSRDVKDEGPERKKKKFDFTKCATRHILLKLLYLGWDYQGFTVQEDTTKTIEHELFAALEKCCLIEKRETSNYHRCGRTDKGVSAFSQVVSLDVRSKLSKEELETGNDNTEDEIEYPKLLNRVLPSEIRVLAWSPASTGYSARFDCAQRTYKYFFPRGNLDIELMISAARDLVGIHDFRNFCKMDVGNGVVNYDREIRSVSIQIITKDPLCPDEESAYDMCEVTLVGLAFLWHQIRCIMGVLFLVGQGHEKPEVVKELLDVQKHPKKPHYNLASHVPLNLFDCVFDSAKWFISTEVLSEVITSLQSEWTTCSVKSSMLRSMLQECEDSLPSDVSVKKQSSSLIHGVTSKVYKPLLERPTCSSLEDRISHFVSKGRLQLKPEENDSSS